jgi:hypothetical protein
MAGAGPMLFYVVVVAGSSGSWDHLADQARRDWCYLIAARGSHSGPASETCC